MRRYGSPPRHGQRYRRRHGVYAILPLGKRVLLTCQSAPDPEIQLPGGGVDKGEQPLAALHREVLEETGWRIGGVRRLGLWRRFTFMPEYDLWAEKLCTVYLALPVRRLGPPSEPDHRALWLTPAMAARVAVPGDAEWLERWAARIEPASATENAAGRRRAKRS